MRILRLALALSAFMAPAWAQQIRWGGTTGVLSGSGTTVTVQQPATGAKSVGFESATVYCSAACTVTQTQNGTAATTTAGTLQPITGSSGSPVTTFWTASNVGSGTAVPGPLTLPAGAVVILDLAKVSLPAVSSTAVNYSIVVVCTGSYSVTIYGGER